MQLYIDDDTSMKDLQDQFSSFFPFLQIRFYKITCCEAYATCKSANIAADQLLKPLMNESRQMKLSLKNETTVGDVIKIFSDFGLRVHILRKFGTFWIQTSLTDDWTLNRQNEEALMLNMPIEKLLPENITINGKLKDGN